MGAGGTTGHDTVLDEVVDGKYQLLREIGSGAQGRVYEARVRLTGQIVALKRLRSEFSRSPDLVRRFLQEAATVARFSHPNIVQMLDVGQDPSDGALYLVQPLLSGTDLGEVLAAHGRLDAREALDLIVPLMAALIAVHRAGVIHRDLKPENIRLLRDPLRGVRPVLIDFGVAKLLDADPSQRTGTGVLVGTPLYMSPEQATGDSSIDARADVWAVGVILFEMIAGRTPITATALPDILVRVVSEPAPRLDALVPGVSPQLADIVARSLSIPREERYRSMAAFLEALLECPSLDAGATGPELAARHEPALAAEVPLDAMPTTRMAPVMELPTLPRTPVHAQWISPALVARVARDPGISRPPGANRSRLGAVALLLVGIGLGAAIMALLPRRSDSSFVVSIAAEPSSAMLELDGMHAGVGRMERSLPRDGRSHVLRLSAPGFISREVTFRDVAPAPRQVLAPEPTRE